MMLVDVNWTLGLFLAGSTIIGCLIAVFIIRRQIAAEAAQVKAEVAQRVADFTAPGEDDTPSEFALATQAVAHLFAEELSTILKASLMGQASGVSRAMDGMQAEIAGEAVEQQNPMLALLMAFSPALKKKIVKNPLAALALAQGFKGGGIFPGNGEKAGGKSDQLGMKM